MIIYSYVHRYNKPQPCKHLDSQHSDPGRLKGDVSFSLGEEFVRHVDQGLGDITRKDDVETGVACSNTEKNLVTIWKDLERSGKNQVLVHLIWKEVMQNCPLQSH